MTSMDGRDRWTVARWRAVLVVAVVLLAAAVVPSPLRRHPAFDRFGPDKLLHLLGHAGLAAVLADALAAEGFEEPVAMGISVGASTGYSMLTGHLQKWVPGRVPEHADLVAGIFGSVLGVLGWRRVVAEADRFGSDDTTGER